MNYTYLLECADHTLYCGWTNDLEKRVKAHNSGLGAKYTKSRRPVTLVYFETFETKEEAMRREAAIKRLTRYEKLKLVSLKKGPRQQETDQKDPGQRNSDLEQKDISSEMKTEKKSKKN